MVTPPYGLPVECSSSSDIRDIQLKLSTEIVSYLIRVSVVAEILLVLLSVVVVTCSGLFPREWPFILNVLKSVTGEGSGWVASFIQWLAFLVLCFATSELWFASPEFWFAPSELWLASPVLCLAYCVLLMGLPGAPTLTKGSNANPWASHYDSWRNNNYVAGGSPWRLAIHLF